MILIVSNVIVFNQDDFGDFVGHLLQITAPKSLTV